MLAATTIHEAVAEGWTLLQERGETFLMPREAVVSAMLQKAHRRAVCCLICLLEPYLQRAPHCQYRDKLAASLFSASFGPTF